MKRLIAPLLVVALAGVFSSTAVAQEEKIMPEGQEEARDGGGGCVQTSLIRFCVTNSGRLYDVQTPIGVDQLWNGEYELCTQGGSWEGSTSWFPYSTATTPSWYQPNGPGTLPLSVTVRNATNNWQIKWSYSQDSTEKEFIVTAAVKRLISPSWWAYLQLSLDWDVSETNFTDAYDYSYDTTWQRGTTGRPWAIANWMASYSSFPTHYARVASLTNLYLDGSCVPPALTTTPSIAADVGTSLTYYLGPVSGGYTKTVKFQFSRR